VALQVYRAGWLFDGLGSELIDDGMVVVEAGRILDVGRHLHIPAGAEVVDLPSSTVLPGLVDCHTHLCWGAEAVPHQWVDAHTPARLALRMAAQARRTLAAGVTLARDLGSTGGLAIDLGQAIESGDLDGPLLVAAGRAIAMTGGHAAQIAMEVDGCDAVTAAVRSEIKRGAGCIKVMASGGVYGEREHIDEPQLSIAEMIAAVTAAHQARVKVAAHAYTEVPMNRAIDAGVDSIEHGSYLDEPTARRMAAAGVYLVPTMTAYEVMTRQADAVDAPLHIRRKTAQVREASRAATTTALRLGVPLAAGSDSGGSGNVHGTFPEEARLLVECGASVEEAIRICTSAGAALCGIDDETGSLQPGRRADLLFVEGDLSRDVRRLSRPRLIVRSGHRLLPDQLLRSVPRIPDRAADAVPVG
jgi:imidazolonepropionase-like amidohydrolase